MGFLASYWSLLLAFVLASGLAWLGRRRPRRPPHWDGLK